MKERAIISNNDLETHTEQMQIDEEEHHDQMKWGRRKYRTNFKNEEMEIDEGEDECIEVRN